METLAFLYSAVISLDVHNKLMNPANPTPIVAAATRTPFLPAPLELFGLDGFGLDGFGGVVGEPVALAEFLGMPLVPMVATTFDVEVEFAELIFTLPVPLPLMM